jgi:uncharacterized protein
MGGPEFIALGVVLISGLMRGITGFGGAMLMAPPLSLLFGPVPAVVTALMLETAAAVVTVPDAWPRFRRRTLLFLLAPACVTTPIGVYLLVSLDPVIARRLIGAIVVLFSLLLFAGVRYAGAPRPRTLMALGSIAGVLLGATSAGAPPVIVYLLSGPDPQRVTRANLIVFITVISIIGLVALFASGEVTLPVMGLVALLIVPYLAATWVGGRLFSRLTELGARRIALSLMLAAGSAGLLL